MGGSGRGKRSGNSTGKNDDPLAGLYQIDTVDSTPLEEKALVLMARMLDDVEGFGELSDNLRSIMAEDELVEAHVLSLFRTLINGISIEHKYLKMYSMP